MEYLLITLYTYLIIGFFYLVMTSFLIFKSKKGNEHKQTITSKWKTLWEMPNFGKVLAVVTILISAIWLLIGWPNGIYTGFKRLKKQNDEI